MTGESGTDRARALLRAAGFSRAEVQAAGHDGTIAVISGLPPEAVSALAPHAAAIKALGFRYVTLDITGAAA